MKNILFFFLLIISLYGLANKPSSEIYVDLQKLQSLKRILYIAAHPDDENTRALAWFSLGEKAETAYLALTRGDGGQNLIGNELSEQLGVLRTQELLAARSYDKANQYFTRAVDFGYSKSAEESLHKWGKDELLADVVLTIRKFQPDVIITRFPPDKRAGHGHHTASAILAIEAFKKAANPNFLPEQVKEFGSWKTNSIYWNASSWAVKNLPEKAKDNPNYLVIDIGGYNTLLGKSYNEIGTIARSQHKCQGFGAIIERGSRLEYFEYLDGEKLTNSFFKKNTRTWTKLVNKEFDERIKNLVANFNFNHPEKNVTELLKIRKGLDALPPSFLKEEKIKQCDKLILDCLGFHAELLAKDFVFEQNDSTFFRLELLNRSNIPVSVVLDKKKINLKQNVPFSKNISFASHPPISNPYWLNKSFKNLFQVADKNNLLQATSKPSFQKKITLIVENQTLTIPLFGMYKWRVAAYGEKRRNVIQSPKFSANFEEKLTILKPESEKIIKIKVHSFKDNLSEKLTLKLPQGWEANQQKFNISINKKHKNKWITFKLKPTKTSKSGTLKLLDSKGNQVMAYTEIAYNHIPTQVIFSKAQMKCVKLDAKIKQGKIAYIKGVEDAVPAAIEQLGFSVKVFQVNELSGIDLTPFQTIVLGIRIYNIHPELRNIEGKLFEYVKNGGNLIMQYNTASWRVKLGAFGPLPFKLTRNRVTEEDATVKFLNPKHPILNVPNKITKVDFDNWVQERGLYFAGNWDKAYTPLFSWKDKGESPQKGALIVAKYGKGQFVYTGISFFRELPNGVEGAYRLFANLLSY